MSVIGIEACSFRGIRREFFVHLASQTSLGLFYDDPNKVSEVENIIVDFYNGMTKGGFKRGCETPRCGFVLACNFTIGKLQRLLSRVVIIPYSTPGIQAHTEEQQQAYSGLKRLKAEASCSIGLIIAFGQEYKASGAFMVDQYEEKLIKLLLDCVGRTVKGYANLIWFTKQVAKMVGKQPEYVWDAFATFAPTLNSLQQRSQSICCGPQNKEEISTQFWIRVGSNLLKLAEELGSLYMVRAFLQFGTQDRKESLSIAFDVAKKLMQQKNITSTFTLSELRDYIMEGKCGVRSQTRHFHKLSNDLVWNGDSCAIKVPVVHLHDFPKELALKLIRCVNPRFDETTSPLFRSTSQLSSAPTDTPPTSSGPKDVLSTEEDAQLALSTSGSGSKEAPPKSPSDPVNNPSSRSNNKRRRGIEALIDSLHPGFQEIKDLG